MSVIPRYFEAESYDAAVGLAAAFFRRDPKKLYLELIHEADDENPCQILAVFETKAGQCENMSASFKLQYEESGVYLEIYPKRGEGRELDKIDAVNYIVRKNIDAMNQSMVSIAINREKGRVKIAPPQDEIILSEEVKITVAANEMRADIVLLPPDKFGKRLDKDTLLQRLEEAGVVFGIDHERLTQVLEERSYEKSYLVAEGLMPVNGKDGYLEFFFRRELTKAPKLVDEFKVDLRTLDLFEPVKENQRLITRHLPTLGEPGYTVRGKLLQQVSGKHQQMPKFKNAYLSEDGHEMFSSLNGMVSFDKNTVTVSNIYTVSGNCDMGIGNIDFDGSVVINGNVIAGMLIKATGSISIGGLVEASDIIAGGNVEIKVGIQGMDKGSIVAGGNIATQFIERAKVKAGQSIFADAILHSEVEAGYSLNLSGRRGSILGGFTRVTHEVIANAIGSVSHTQTEIQVGILPEHRNRIKFLETEMDKINIEFDKLQKMSLYLSKPNSKMTQERRDELRAAAIKSARHSMTLFKEMSDELRELQELVSTATDGKVHVFNKVYRGVRITISSGVYSVNDDINFATFKYRDGEVVFGACEMKR